MKKYLIFLFSFSLLFAEDLVQFPTSNEQNVSKDVVGDDSLPKSNIDRGLNYGSQIGTTSIDIVKDESGNKQIININSEQQAYFKQDDNTSDAYKSALNSYNKAVDSNDTAAITKAKTALKAAAKDDYNKRYSVSQHETTFFKGLNASGKGYVTVQNIVNPDENSTVDKNVSNYYKSNLTYMQSNNTVNTMNNSNAGALINAFQYVKNFENQLRSKMEAAEIKCFISRELIPAYYCPFPDMTNTSYPDFSNPVLAEDAVKTSSQEAKKMCDDVCKKQRTCIPYNVLSDTKVDTSAAQTSFSLYPTYDDNASKVVVSTEKSMQVDKFSFQLKIVPSDDFNGTAAEFETFLQNAGIKIKFDILSSDSDSVPPTMIVDKAIIYAKSASSTKEISVLRANKKFTVKIYKPYIHELQMEQWRDTPIFSKIKSISVNGIDAAYTSKDLYFCAFRQLVENKSDCKGEVLDISDSSSVYHVCTDSDKRIGPNAVNGGFYSEQSCFDACSEVKECMPTYRHYADVASSADVNKLFKAKIGCVDGDDNQACTVEKCQAFFADDKIRPNDEIVVQNDNERVYTVRNKALTDVFRPKINLDAETNTATTDYDAMFQSEMKDAAYNSMIKNGSFDRISYLIGTPSPMKQAYQKDTVNGITRLNVLLKPNSFNVNDGVNYNLYSVIKFEQAYRPRYGLFTLAGNQIDAVNQEIMFKDVVYMVKKPTGDWLVFKQIFFAKVKEIKNLLICVVDDSGENVTTTETNYIGQAYDGSKCKVQNSINWVDVPAYTVDRNVFYDSGSDSFIPYSLSEIVPSYQQIKFTNLQDYSNYSLTEYLERDLDMTPGGMIHSQISNDGGSSFSRVYNGNFDTNKRGYASNVYAYSFYSSSPISYNDLMNTYLVDNNIIWELANPKKYSSEIKDDTEIKGNNINAFILGKPGDTTLTLDVAPKISEEGKRAFKFIFLYDPAVTDPFKNYSDSNSTLVK